MNKKIILFSLCALFIVSYISIKFIFVSKVNQCLINKDRRIFNYINKFYTRFLLTPFKIELYKLKFYMLNNDKDKIKQQIKFFENNMRLTTKQKAIISEHIFYEYFKEKDYQKCKDCLEQIKIANYNCKDLPYIEMIVDIYYYKNNKHLGKLETALINAKENNDIKKIRTLEILIKESKNNAKKKGSL